MTEALEIIEQQNGIVKNLSESNDPIRIEPIGVCDCGQIATVYFRSGISPGVWTHPKKICQDCINKIFSQQKKRK